MNYINYILTILGIFMIIVSLILIFADKIKGENIYYNLHMKEQDIKNAIAEAEEIMNELIYVSESIADDKEESTYKKIQKRIENDINGMELKKENISKALDDSIETINYETNTIATKNEKLNKTESEIDEKISKREEAKKLLDQGMAVEDVAKRLNIGKGEVSLILSLSKRDKE